MIVQYDPSDPPVKDCSRELPLFPLKLVSLKNVERKALSAGRIEE